MGNERALSLQPGTVIAGRYEVVKCLGAGSMGLVYACRHRELSGHLVAAKVLFTEVAQDKVAAQRFKNEIFASYGVSHPNVVRAYEYIRDGDLIAYTMEFVGGGDLAERLDKPEPLPISEIIRLLSQISSGVQAIHDAGIVHRDLKPENILLTKDGQVKIADFGIARTEKGPKLTEHGGVVGTIDYVSPEYMLESKVDWRSDIYAIGILGYEMITGEPPFRGESVYAAMTKRLKTDPTPPSVKRSDCPVELDNIILRAMRRVPEERYQSSAEMYYDLRKLMPESRSNEGLVAPPTIPGGVSNHGGANRGPAASEAENSVYFSADSGAGMTSGQSSVASASMVRPSAPETAPTIAQVVSDSSVSNKGYIPDPAAARMEKERAIFMNRPKSRRGGQESIDSQAGEDQMLGRGNDRTASDRGLAGDDGLEDDLELSPSPNLKVETPARLESVLAYRDLVSGPWKGPTPSKSGVRISLEGDKLARLSLLAGRGQKSNWLEVLTVILAVLLGIVITIMVVRAYSSTSKNAVTKEFSRSEGARSPYSASKAGGDY